MVAFDTSESPVISFLDFVVLIWNDPIGVKRAVFTNDHGHHSNGWVLLLERGNKLRTVKTDQVVQKAVHVEEPFRDQTVRAAWLRDKRVFLRAVHRVQAVQEARIY